MTHHKEIFADCVIEIRDDANLTINGKTIDFDYDSEENKWSSRYLPYTQHGSLLELAKSIAQLTADFSTQKNSQ